MMCVNVRRAFVSAAFLSGSAFAGPATFMVLGDLANGQGGSAGLGVSADGRVVVGWADSPNGSEAFRWTSSTGMVGLGLPTDWFPEFEDSQSFASAGTACSGDGNVVAGYVVENKNGNLKGFRWTPGTGMQKLVEVGYNAGRAVSLDGNYIAGETYTGFLSATGFRWSEEEGMTGIDTSGFQSLAWGISHDGSRIAGQYRAFPGQAFLWESGAGLTTLGDIPGGPEDSGANAISGDGTTVVGFGSDNDFFADKFQAVRWRSDTGMIGLGRLHGTRLSSAFGASGDGNTVVGFSFSSGSSTSEKAFIWTPDGGMQDLAALLTAQGADLQGYRLNIAYAVSADGRTIVGNASRPGRSSVAFIARLGDSCPACIADFNSDGGVDGSDVEAFYGVWEDGESCADVNNDGGVDGADVEAFFAAWEGGSC